MKKLGYLLLPVLLLAALAAYLSTGGSEEPPSPAEARTLEPAPYPPDFPQELERLGSAGVSVTQGSPEELPCSLEWREGRDEPEIGDPAARKGGRMRLCNVGPYPENWLAFGSPTLQFFHYNLFTTVDVPLVVRHPVTGREIPGLARAWAQQERTLYFRLDPRARYSNGRPVRAGDFALALVLCHRVGAREWDVLRNQLESLRLYGDHCFSVTLRQSPPPLAASRLGAVFRPAEPGFYAEAAGDYQERYRHRVPPTTGAYTLGRAQRGRLIELVRVRDWWARDDRYRRHTCNVDFIEHHFLTDEAQAWELLLRGRLDALQTRNIVTWQQRLANEPAVEQGRLVPHDFRADYPMPPYGIVVNAQTVPDIRLRRGLMQALDMDRAVTLIFRGEGERLRTFSTGYGALTPASTPEYRYDPAAARACFAEAGYTETGADGVLRKADGTRLSLSFSYVPSEKIGTLATVLAQSAAACGVELKPDPQPWQSCAAKLRERRYELAFWATVASQPLPAPSRHFASDATGDEAPFALRDAEMDAALAAWDTAADDASRAAALAEVDRLVYDRAVWLPGWKENIVHLAAWSHVRFPDVPGCRFSTPEPFEVAEAHLYWIDPTAPTTSAP